MMPEIARFLPKICFGHQLPSRIRPFACVSLGAWCRSSWQLKRFCKSRRHFFISSPFDWTITPYESLEFIANNTQQMADLVLCEDNISVSSVGSLQCDHTGLIFHHDLSPSFVKTLSADGPVDLCFGRDYIAKSRQRFIYTYGKLLRINELSDKYPILFVRWQRFGIPDKQIPSVFNGESISSLRAVIHKLTGLSNFFLLTVTTQDEPASWRPVAHPFLSFSLQDNDIEVKLRERYLGRRSKEFDFQGDSDSWDNTLGIVEQIITKIVI